jgi:Mg2+ and Co2+ transporter CorA
MKVVKSIVGVLIIIISIVFLVVSVAGIVGIWVYADEYARNTIDAVFTPVQTAVTGLKEGTTSVNSALDDATAALEEIDANLEETEEGSSTTLQTIGNILTVVTDKLEPDTSEISSKVEDVRQKGETVAEVIDTLNALPFISLPEPGTGKLAGVLERVGDLKTQVAEMKEARTQQAKTDLVMTVLANNSAEIGSLLEDVQEIVTGLDSRLSEIETRLATLRSDIWNATHLSFVVLSVILLWLGISQVGMLLHGWHMVKN